MTSFNEKYRSIDTPFGEDELVLIYPIEGPGVGYKFTLNNQQYHTVLPVDPKSHDEWKLVFKEMMRYFDDKYSVDLFVEIAGHKFQCTPFTIDDSLPSRYILSDLNGNPAIRWMDGKIEHWEINDFVK